MYQLSDNFQAYDENRQPYSFRVERHTETANLHAWVKEDRFYLSSIGNRHILNTPAFCHGTFEMEFQFTYMDVFPADFTILFQYDEVKRQGKGVRFIYDLKCGFEVSLVEIDKSCRKALCMLNVEIEKPLVEDKFYDFVMQISDTQVSGRIAGAGYVFLCQCAKGRIALERSNYIGELVLNRITFVSEDTFSWQSVIRETKVEIPTINGGDIPYTITWKADRIEEEYYLTAKLDGGTRTRSVNREDRPGQYVAQIDYMISPYIGIATSEKRGDIYYLAQGERCFVDPNIYWDCQKGFFGDTELPITKMFRLSELRTEDKLEIIFGYEKLMCRGYFAQEGGNEFRYTPDGRLVVYGPAPDGQDIYEVSSQKNKLALSFVPEDCYRREDVLDHIKNNHYFDVSEDMEFALEMKTMKTPEYITIKATVLNVYETEEIMVCWPQLECNEWKYGYHIIRAVVSIPKMNIGVRKIKFSIYYGEELLENIIKTFEVFDKDSNENPAIASGLPFVFSMPNEQKWLASNSFDLWSPVKSCNLEHYITCTTDTPLEAEERQSWRLVKQFKREWFAWLASRTCRNWHLEEHLDVVKNADYLFCSWNEQIMDLGPTGLYPIRQDHFSYESFLKREETRIGILEDFLKENPELAEQIDYKVGMKQFTFAHFVNLMKTCPEEWIAYQNQKGVEILKSQNEEICKINPNFKRSIYGPINVYVNPPFTGHTLKAYGFSDGKTISRDIFTGFAIFEDYPYSCSYQTYRGAFGLMNILLETPELTIYPEQYKGGRGGCIDGAVKFAHAPMGAYELLPYQNSTHAFECVFNTAYRLKDGYHYWNTYGFHRPDYHEDFMEKLILDWKYVVENKPQKPLRSIAFLVECSDQEDMLEIFDTVKDENKFYWHNRSEAGLGLVFECGREAGVPNGFGLKFDCLKTLSAMECDVLVLPSLAFAKEEYVQEIRRLYEEGVNLIAVSEVNGLEDIFGVYKEEKTIEIESVCYEGEKELVRSNLSHISYAAKGAEVTLQSGKGEALAMCTERTLLINTDVMNLGCEDKPECNWGKTVHIVGEVVKKLLKNEIRRLSTPLALGHNVGITLFKTLNGKRKLLAIDYTPFDNRAQKSKQAVITLNMDDATDVKADRKLFVGKKDGVVKELRFEILPHESVFIDI